MTFAPKSLCVFCGSRAGNDAAYEQEARALGQHLAQEGITLTYGGGSVGLMGVVADEVLSHGGQVVGVIPDFLQKHEVGHGHLTELIITDNMHDRKRTMFERSDGFIVLPGGLGTLDETFEIMTWKQLRLHDKPIFILDTADYWAPFQRIVEQTIDGGFAHERVKDLYCRVKSTKELFAAFNDIPPVNDIVLTSHL